MSKETELQVRAGDLPAPSMMDNFLGELEKAKTISAYMVDADLVPDSFYGVKYKNQRTKETYELARKRYAVALVYGFQMGLKLHEVSQGLYVVDGKVAVYGELAVRQMQRHENYSSHDFVFDGDIGDDNFCCRGIFKTKDGNEYTISYSKQDALRAGLWPTAKDPATKLPSKVSSTGTYYQDNWCKGPKDMMRYKVISRALKFHFPGATLGLQMGEDMEGEAGPRPVPSAVPEVSEASDEKKAELMKLVEGVRTKAGLPETDLESLKDSLMDIFNENYNESSPEFRKACADLKNEIEERIAKNEDAQEVEVEDDVAEPEPEPEEEATSLVSDSEIALARIMKSLEKEEVTSLLKKGEITKFRKSAIGNAIANLKQLTDIYKERSNERKAKD